jgi:hypothetical protein
MSGTFGCISASSSCSCESIDWLKPESVSVEVPALPTPAAVPVTSASPDEAEERFVSMPFVRLFFLRFRRGCDRSGTQPRRS